ncbi:MAG TPA: hypothetical protein VFJ85_03015 [Acidimicrobiales bacterium]|nr:hypothetical protein [Acidimicrobiales bacterium]
MADPVRITVLGTIPLSLAARSYGRRGEVVVETTSNLVGEQVVQLRLVSADGIEFAGATLTADQWRRLIEAVDL